MRELTTPDSLERFMVELGRRVRSTVSVYFTGGATAVLHGWRETTIDVDVKFVPDSDEALRAVAGLKDALRINVELASPDQFIPELPGWTERSVFIAVHGTVSYFHYDLSAQALAKIERGHAEDAVDVQHMLDSRLVDPRRLVQLFEAIEPELYRFPAVDPASFRTALDQTLASHDADPHAC